MDIVFDKLPQSLEEMKNCEYGSLEKPEYTAALFIVAMTHYTNNPDMALEMVDFLNGPANVSPYDRQFLNDRMRDKEYLPWSFFKGATPDNDYEPSIPYTIKVEKNPHSEIKPDYVKLFIASGGADSPRPIELKLKPSTNQWFMVNQLLLSGIRIPKSKDEWA